MFYVYFYLIVQIGTAAEDDSSVSEVALQLEFPFMFSRFSFPCALQIRVKSSSYSPLAAWIFIEPPHWLYGLCTECSIALLLWQSSA